MSNVPWFFNALTSNKISDLTNGRVKPMTPEQAAGMIGGWIVETGDPTLRDLDVVERGNGNAGRGLSQFTGSRRRAYDQARSTALARGQDVNSREWQLQYFADEYMGKYDPNGNSLSGWTKSLDANMPTAGSAEDYALHFSNNYFRPGVPHNDRRMRHAAEVFAQLGGSVGGGNTTQKASEWLKTMPGGDVEAQAPAQVTAPQGEQVRAWGTDATLNGKPVKWAGDNYGWQSPETFATIEQPTN